MGNDKTFIFTPEQNGSGGGLGALMGMIPALLNGKGLDPNLVAALMNNRNNQEGWGGGCWWIWVILLFFIWGWGGNGNGFGGRGLNGLPAELNNDAGRELLMNAIQGNANAINQLSSSLGCSVQQLQSAICNIQGSIDKVSGQIGMSSQQVINAIQNNASTLGAQLASCCCDIRTAIERQGCDNRLATLEQTTTLTNQSNSQFNILGAKIDAQTQIIQDKFCQLEMREMQNKIDTLRAEKSALELGISQAAQTANIVNQLKAPCPVPSFIVPNPNCCYGNPTVVFGGGNPYPYNDGCGCNC